MTPPPGSKASFLAAAAAAAAARGITDPEQLARIRVDARDLYESRLARDPKTGQAL